MYTHADLSTTAANAVLPDKRLTKRLQRILSQLEGKLEASIPVAFADPGQSKAYYRFINNAAVSELALLHCSRSQALQAARQQGVVLAVQDTTQLDFTGKRSANALGCLSYPQQKGLLLHNHLLLTQQGQVLGLLDQEFFERDAAKLGGSKKKRHQPFAQKESARWLQQFNQLQTCFQDQPHQQVIQICDREADIHELLQARTTAHVHYIIRSSQNRCSAPAADRPPERIWQQIAGRETQFSYRLPVDHPQHGPRVAQLQVRYGAVVIKPGYRPKQQEPLCPVELWLIETSEVAPPAGVEPLCWRLLTSLPLTGDELAGRGNELAQDVIRYYTYRWRIERFHYVLKQGAQVEQLQLQQVPALKKALILYSWIALKVLQTQHCLGNQPQAPITSIGLSELDYRILYQYLKAKAVKLPPLARLEQPPTLGQWAHLLALSLGRKLPKEGTIGVVALWRAYHKFLLIREAYDAFIDVGNP
jgi:hypothetical protein